MGKRESHESDGSSGGDDEGLLPEFNPDDIPEREFDPDDYRSHTCPFHSLSVELDVQLAALERDRTTRRASGLGAPAWALSAVEMTLQMIRWLRYTLTFALPAPPDVESLKREDARKALVLLQEWCDNSAATHPPTSPRLSDLERDDDLAFNHGLAEISRNCENRETPKPPRPRQQHDWDETVRIASGWDRKKYRTIARYAAEIDMPVAEVRAAIDRARKGPPKGWKSYKDD